MKNILKVALFVFVAVVGLSSCNKEQYTVKYDESQGERYTFSQTLLVEDQLSAEHGGKFKVGVRRTKAEGAVSFDLKLSGDKPWIAAPALFTLENPTVSFADGEYEASVYVNFNLDALSPAGAYKFGLTYADAEYKNKTSYGGKDTVKITAQRKLNFVEIEETGVYAGALGGPYGFYLEQAIEAPNVFKIVDLFKNKIIIQIDYENNTASIDAQNTGDELLVDGKIAWIECKSGVYNPITNVVTFGGGTWDNVYWVDDTFGSGYRMLNEQFLIPVAQE